MELGPYRTKPSWYNKFIYYIKAGILKNLYRIICFGVILLANAATFANVTTESEAKINDKSHLVTVDLYNGSGVFVSALGNQNNNGYISGDVITFAFSSNGWKLPVGSYFCVSDNESVDRFLVVGTPSEPDLDNTVSIWGSVFHTWFNEEYKYPGLKYLGYVKASVDDSRIQLCSEGFFSTARSH
jgi:hypothetical protein